METNEKKRNPRRALANVHAWLQAAEDYLLAHGYVKVEEYKYELMPGFDDFASSIAAPIVGQIREGYPHYGGKWDFYGFDKDEKDLYPLLRSVFQKTYSSDGANGTKHLSVAGPYNARKFLLAASTLAASKDAFMYGPRRLYKIKYPWFFGEEFARKVQHFALLSELNK